MSTLFNNKVAYFCEKVEPNAKIHKGYAMSEILKCFSVATKIETSGRSKLNWITSEIEMIAILKMNSRQYVPRIYPFKYWYEL
jgi:hypothetical protein